MTTDQKTIRIAQGETIAQSWMRDASSYALAVALIGSGVWVESSAMQWLGALVFFVVSISKGSGLIKDMTIEQAREYLDNLETDQ